MLQNFENWNESAQKVAGIVLIVFMFFACFVAQLVFTFLGNIQEKKIQEQQTTWVKPQPITTQEEKQKVKSFWSLKLTFEEGGSDE